MTFQYRRAGGRCGVMAALLAMGMVWCGLGYADKAGVVGLRCEYLENPSGIDVTLPRLSWELSRSGWSQGAYRILVASSEALLKKEKGDLWDTGRVKSSRQSQVAYAGTPLKSGQACFWKVRVWDEKGASAGWSAPARWSMGLLSAEDWKAQWIAQPAASIPEGTEAPSPWLRTCFELAKKPVRATAYVASLGYHELSINGKKVDDTVLGPAVSDYAKRAYYLTYDVTDLLKPGKQCVGLWLGRGWYFPGYPGVVHPGPVVRAQLELEYADGSVERVLTDASWRVKASPYRTLGEKSFAHGSGERYEAALALPEWDSPDLDDSAWESAEIVEPVTERLVAQPCQPNRIQKEIAAVGVETLPSGEYLIDMGRNLSGYFELRLGAAKGQTVLLEYVEHRYADGELRTYGQHDEYVPDQDGEAVFKNRFNYHSFRWVKVSGVTRPPKTEDARAWLIRTDFPVAGSFACSNDLLNRIHDIIVYTYECLSLGGYMVDCPHRERLGYGGDGAVTMETGLYSFGTGAMDTKWLDNWKDAQDPETGFLPNTAPYPHPAGGGPTWGAISVLMPWQMYLHYADTRVLEECYPMMQAYMRFLDSKSDGTLLRPYGNERYGFLGDWVAPDRDQDIGIWSEESWRVFFNNCFYLHLAHRMETIAKVLGKESDAQAYAAQAQRIQAAAHAEFYQPEDHSYVCGEQPYLAFALLSGMVPEDQREGVIARLEKEILVNQKSHIHAGMHGSYFLIKQLNLLGRDDLVFAMANQTTYPGWGYMLEQGATTIWERWDDRHSHIHSTLLGIGSWFVSGLAGIQPDPEHPGFEHIVIRPAVVGDLEWVRAEYESIRGPIRVDWRLKDGRFFLNVSIPPNSTATIALPAKEGSEILEGARSATDRDSVRTIVRGQDSVSIEVASGDYSFAVDMP